jgi:MinD superfamily P-loop ATPase
MIAAIASGKGGTSKTMAATSLVLSVAANWGPRGEDPPPLAFLDCDAEEPNAALFLKPPSMLLIVDGPPRIGCPVIAASAFLMVRRKPASAMRQRLLEPGWGMGVLEERAGLSASRA